MCFWNPSRNQGSFSGCRRIWNDVESEIVDSMLGMLKKDAKHKCEELEGQHQRSQSQEQFWCHFELQYFHQLYPLDKEQMAEVIQGPLLGCSNTH